MNVKVCVVGSIGTNCYIVEDAGELLVVDPGDNLEDVLKTIGQRKVSEIVCTHGHWDHVGAVSGLVAATGASVAANENDSFMLEHEIVDGHDISHGYGAPVITRFLAQDDEVHVGSTVFKVIETPGHSEGSICLYSDEEHVLICGDTLFAGGRYGRTDFEGGSFEAIVTSMSEKLAMLPDETLILPGHERQSTMKIERSLNSYLRA